MIIYAISVAVYLVGAMIFLSAATWGIGYWTPIFHVWDKAKDFLFLTSIYYAPKHSDSLKAMIIFTLCRFVWEVISAVSGWNINNKKAVGILFILSAVTIGWILYKELKKWRKLNLLQRY